MNVCCNIPALQVLSDVTEDNLIDLGPGSPAVVSPMVGGTAVVSPMVGGTVAPSALSSQLAGLGECVPVCFRKAK